jgi:hypothetical protein
MRFEAPLLFVSALVVLGSIVLLVALHQILVTEVVSGLPFGVISTWAGLLALPLAFWSAPRLRSAQTPSQVWVQRALLVLVASGTLWGVVAWGLAGNWNYTFSGTATAFRGSPRASVWFWRGTGWLVALSLAAPVLWGGAAFLGTAETGDAA